MIRLPADALWSVLHQRRIYSHACGSCDSFHKFAKRLAYGFVALWFNIS